MKIILPKDFLPLQWPLKGQAIIWGLFEKLGSILIRITMYYLSVRYARENYFTKKWAAYVKLQLLLKVLKRHFFCYSWIIEFLFMATQFLSQVRVQYSFLQLLSPWIFMLFCTTFSCFFNTSFYRFSFKAFFSLPNQTCNRIALKTWTLVSYCISQGEKNSPAASQLYHL